MDVSWTTKQAKPQGRNTINGSRVSCKLHGPQVPLNAKKFVRAAATQLWGGLANPTIAQIISILLEFAKSHSRDDFVMWKVDVSGAYPQLKVNPDDAHLLGSELVKGWIMVNHHGTFGLSVTPYAFEVISRLLRVIVSDELRVEGVAHFYTDDGIGFSSRALYQEHMAKAAKAITMMGQQAVNVEKSQHSDADSSRTLVAIGCLFDLQNWVTDLPRSNRLKMPHTFMTINTNLLVPLKTMQAIASLAWR
jgi:hypothetical protein